MNMPRHNAVARPARIHRGPRSAFTLIEIALSIGIIAFALIAIIGVLPHGMEVQRDNREETVINQDAIVLMDLLRSGSMGADDLTNYVLGIVVSTNNINSPVLSYINPWLSTTFDFTNIQTFELNSGSNIIGLMSFPKYTEQATMTNTVTVYMRSISGNASDKPPQLNSNIRDLGFSYRLTTEVAPYYSDIQSPSNEAPQDILVAQNLHTNLYQLRLTFRWPLLPNGGVGSGRLTFRTMTSGYISTIPNPLSALSLFGPALYFLQPSTFAAAQPSP